MILNDTLSTLGTKHGTYSTDTQNENSHHTNINAESSSLKSLKQLLAVQKVSPKVFVEKASSDLSGKSIKVPPKESILSIDLSIHITTTHSKKIELSHQIKQDIEEKIVQLGNKKYIALVEYLRNNRGFPFNEISLLNMPDVMEMLFHLNDALEKKVSVLENIHIHEIMQYALTLTRKIVSDNSSIPEIENLLSQIGKLLFLVDKNPLEVIKNLEKRSFEEWIEESFYNHILFIKNEIQVIYTSYIDVYIQNPDVVMSVLIPEKIAEILITNSNQINFGIISDLIKHFVEKPKFPLNHEINLLYGLNHFKESPFCRYRFSQIEAPSNLNKPSQEMIRIMLNIKPKDPIEKIDAQKVILSAMLSHLRQTPTGTCFAESLAIELLSSQLEQCLEDFIEIVKKGKLTRTVSGRQVDFPYIFSSEKSDDIIEISQDGLIHDLKEPGFIFRSPSFIHVCHALEINQPEEFLKKFLVHLFKNYKEAILTISVNKFLKKMVGLILENSDENAKIHLLKKAEFAYECQISNGLLKLWRNAIAGMAEGQETGMIKSSIKASVMHALKINFKGLTSKQSVWLKSFYTETENLLTENVQLKYDPKISRDEEVSGAFVMYDKSDKIHISEWVRIDSAELFRVLILDILKRAYARSKPIKNIFHTEKTSCSIFNKIVEFVREDRFIYRLLHNYHVSNFDIDNISDLKLIKYSPWITKCGNNSFKVIEVYLEKDQALTALSFTPKNAKELLLNIIKLGKSLSIKEKLAYKKNPNKLIPIKMKGFHSFSLMLGHKSFFEVFEDSINIETWIETHIETPGLKVSHTVVDEETANKFFEICKNFVNKKDFIEFLRNVEFKENMTYMQFRKIITQQLNTFYPLKRRENAERIRSFDNELIKALPKYLFQILKNSSVHFADTNWSFGIHDVHFCFVINPFNGRMELWEVYDNGSSFMALSQEYWLINRDWEFCNPNQILLENEKLHIH